MADERGGRAGCPEEELARLHPRLRQVLALIAQGHDNAAVARRLGVKVPVVKAYVTELYAALKPPRDRDPRAWIVERYGRRPGG